MKYELLVCRTLPLGRSRYRLTHRMNPNCSSTRILFLREKTGKQRAEEGTGDARGMMLQFPHERQNFVENVLRRIGQLPGMDRNLQSMIQIFIRIVSGT